MLSTWNQIDRLFNDGTFARLHPLATATRTADRETWPAVDIVEEDEAIVFLADLPGLSKADLTLTIEDRVLTLSGERKFEDREGATWHRRERRALRFTRRFKLGVNLDASEADASFEDGVLTLRIPKTEQSKPLTIEVK